MIFLKVPVGMRKTVTLTMEKNVRGGTNITIQPHSMIYIQYRCVVIVGV